MKLTLQRDARGFYSVYHRDSKIVEAFIYDTEHFSRPWTLERIGHGIAHIRTRHCTLGTAFDAAMDTVEATNVHHHA